MDYGIKNIKIMQNMQIRMQIEFYRVKVYIVIRYAAKYKVINQWKFNALNSGDWIPRNRM